MFTQRFSEEVAILDYTSVSGASTEQNTGYVDVSKYHRVAVLILPTDLGGDLDVDLEQATDTSGTSAKSLDSGNKDTTVLSTATDPTIIEIKGEEFDVDNAFDCLNVEITPGASSSFEVLILGFCPRYAPVSTTGYEAVVD